MTDLDYYQAPTDTVFEDIKKNCLAIWSSYDNSFGYATDKKARVNFYKNISDNCLSMVGMFDNQNQVKLFGMLQKESQDFLRPFIQENIRAILEVLGVL